MTIRWTLACGAWFAVACQHPQSASVAPQLPPPAVAGMSDAPAGSAGRTSSAALPASAVGASGSRAPEVVASAGMVAEVNSAGAGGMVSAMAADAGTPATTTLPADAWTAGDYPADPMSETYLELADVPGQKGYVRQYKVHIPPSYDPRVPTPTVFCIHGLSQTAVLFCTIGSSMIEKSDKEGFILVMPNGYEASWNAGTCCGAASTEELDDVGLMRVIFAEVSKHVNIDRKRVYATGFSNGGFMSYRLACDAADIFTAVAPSAGGIGTNDLSAATWDLVESGSAIGATNSASNFTVCAPSRPISVLDLHGTEDGLVAFGFQHASLDLIAQHNGCNTVTQPAADPMSRGDTTCVTYTDCPNGIEVTGCSVQGGGHNWFGSPDCGTAAGDLGCSIVGYNSTVLVNTEAVWNFFARHMR